MKISSENIALISKSSGLIEIHALEISKAMYELLFSLYPEMKLFFKNAPSNQHQLLSETIAVYAVNINNISMLKPALRKIASTHVRVGVQPEHYKIVEEVLLLAIEIVLRDEVTDELLQAWQEAIEYVSSLLMEMERTIKQEET